MAHGQNTEDDFDDIMSRIVGNGPRPAPPLPQQQPVTRGRPVQTIPSHRRSAPHTAQAPRPITAGRGPSVLATPPAVGKHTRRRKIPWYLVATAIVLCVGVASFGLYLGPLHHLFPAPSPFSDELKSRFPMAMYYPASLPKGYAINQDSITSPSTGVMVYSISNGSKSMAITQQKVPPGLSVNDLLATYTDVRKVATHAVPAWVGLQDSTTLVANMITPQTWVIVTTQTSTMSRADFETIVKSLRQG